MQFKNVLYLVCFDINISKSFTVSGASAILTEYYNSSSFVEHRNGNIFLVGYFKTGTFSLAIFKRM